MLYFQDQNLVHHVQVASSPVVSLVVMTATLLAVAAKKRSWEKTCSCEVPTWSLEWWCPPSGWPCPGPGPCCSPHRSRRRPGGCNNFFCNMGGGLSVHYGQHGQHGGKVWVHNKAYGQLAGWSMVIGKAGREEREGLLHQCCCIVSLLTDSPSKANFKSTLEVFFFQLLIKLLTSSPPSLVSDLFTGSSKCTQLSDFTHPVQRWANTVFWIEYEYE